jgi:hypothetical protein
VVDVTQWVCRCAVNEQEHRRRRPTDSTESSEEVKQIIAEMGYLALGLRDSRNVEITI